MVLGRTLAWIGVDRGDAASKGDSCVERTEEPWY